MHGRMQSIEIELLPHGDDRRVVDIALALQLRLQFGLRRLVRLRGDGSEQAELVLGQQFHGALGQGITVVAPAVPADVGMNVFGVEANGFQNA